MTTNRLRTITMETFIDEDSIVYTVIDGYSPAGDFGDAREVWRREVPLASMAAYRAGGYHATEAAREQERVAWELARKHADDESRS
jgi:hypothetical protein